MTYLCKKYKLDFELWLQQPETQGVLHHYLNTTGFCRDNLICRNKKSGNVYALPGLCGHFLSDIDAPIFDAFAKMTCTTLDRASQTNSRTIVVNPKKQNRVSSVADVKQ